MLLGTYSDGGTTGTAWIPSSALPTTNESKTLQGADAASLLLNRIAAEENAKAPKTVPSKPKTTTQQTTTRAEVKQLAKNAGVTEAEYIKFLKTKNIKIID